MRLPEGSSAGVLALACLAALGPASVHAQTQPAPPTPGAIQDSLELRRPVEPGGPPQVLFPGADPQSPHDRNAQRFQVNGFRFIGNTVFNQARLRRIVERYLDLQLNLFDLDRAADAVTRYYRDNGYPVARAIIPAQRVERGVVTMEVIEGRIGKLRFEGNRRYSSEFLAARLSSLSDGSLVTVASMERGLLLLNDLPGVTAKATLQPGQGFGTTDVVVTIEEKPAGIVLGSDNTGRKESGRERIDVAVELNNPLGLGDMLSLRAIRSRHSLLEYNRVGYSLPVGADGGRFSLGHAVTQYRVGGDFEPLGIAGEVRNSDFGYSYPVIRARGRNMSVSVGSRRTETSQTALTLPVVAGRITLFTAAVSGNYTHEDSSATTASLAFSGNFRENLNGAPERMRGKYDVDITHLAGLSPRWDMFLRTNFVMGSGRLPDTEKFSLGGPSSVRGYRSAELRGDDGYLATVEFRRQFTVGGVVGVFALFHDRGAVRSTGFASQDGLRSTGFGVTLYPSRHVRVKADFARPSQGHAPADGKSSGRAWLSVSAAF